MFVDAIINSKPARGTMVDSGATHNFISEQEARRLELKVEKDAGKMKAVNSEALPIVGVSKRVPLQLAEWTGSVDLVVVRMNDFDVVLGMEFLLEHKVIPMPLAKCLIVTNNNPTVVPADIKQPSGVRMISALQLKKGLSREEPTFMAIPIVDESAETEFVPLEIQEILSEYVDVMPQSLPKSLPP